MRKRYDHTNEISTVIPSLLRAMQETALLGAIWRDGKVPHLQAVVPGRQSAVDTAGKTGRIVWKEFVNRKEIHHEEECVDEG